MLGSQKNDITFITTCYVVTVSGGKKKKKFEKNCVNFSGLLFLGHAFISFGGFLFLFLFFVTRDFKLEIRSKGTHGSSLQIAIQIFYIILCFTLYSTDNNLM